LEGDSPRLIDTVALTPYNARTFFQRPDRLPYPLYVVCPIFNAWRWRSRWRLYQDFEKRVADAGAILYTVEAAFGDRRFVVTEAGNPRHIQLRLNDHQDLWLKENLINIGVSRLPADWWAVAWIDGDVTFRRDDWANETLHALQHWPIVQMFSQAVDTGPDHELLPNATGLSFGWCHTQHLPVRIRGGKKGDPYVRMPHPGFAWACRRTFWDAIGGLIDWSILAGGSDWHMAYGFIGEIEWTLSPRHTPGYLRMMREWARRATAACAGHMGVVKGLVLHDWHGHKVQRGYDQREALYVNAKFDPLTDLRRDWQGLWMLNSERAALREAVSASLRARNEDTL